MSEHTWTSPFFKGFAACFTICSVIAAVAVYFNSQVLELKNGQIAAAERELKAREDNQEKYHQEQVFRKQADLKLVQVEQDLAALLAAKWQEKFEAERLQKHTAQEKLAIVETHYKDVTEAVQQGRVEPAKELEIKLLKEELRVARAEVEQLRILYTQEKEKQPTVVIANPTNTPPADAVFNALAVSLFGMDSLDCRHAILSSYQGTSNRITVAQLAQLVHGMEDMDIVLVCESIRPNIINDGNPEAIAALTFGLSSRATARVLKTILTP